MPILSHGEGDLFFTQEGKGEDLVLIGGLTANHTIWELLLPHLAPHFRLLRLDNRGSGRSFVPQVPYTIGDMAEDIVALIDHLNIKTAHVVGHSMGGMILQQLLVAHPERIIKAVVCASTATISAMARLQLQSTALMRAARVPQRIILESVLPWLFSSQWLSDPQRVEGTIQAMIGDPYPQSEKGYAGQVAAIARFDVADKLPHVHTPTLVVAGAEDALLPLSFSEQIAALIPDAQLIVMEKLGHMLQIEAPETLARHILHFLR